MPNVDILPRWGSQGLSLMEMLTQLRDDHASAVAVLEARIAELEHSLADKDSKLKQLLAYLPEAGDGAGALAWFSLALTWY